jgi:hypothetical protein
MIKTRNLLILMVCAASLAACQKTASVCDGWAKLTPNKPTVSFIASNDTQFARGVIAHNNQGKDQGCW